MKSIVSISLAATLTFFSAQSADACTTYQPMAPSDYAFAGVIFEGEISDVALETRYVEQWGNDVVVSTKFLFDVHEVLRGELPGSQVLVGYGKPTFGPSASVDDFVQRYGRHVRVGLVTPEQHKKQCREEMVEYTTGNGEKFEKLRMGCDFGSSQLERAIEIPFVEMAPCGNEFIFDTSKPIVVRKSWLSGRDDKIMSIFKAHSDWFTPDLTEESSKMDRLLEEGLKTYNLGLRSTKLTDEKREEMIEREKARLRKRFLIFANLSETDPELRERFLRDDLTDISR